MPGAPLHLYLVSRPDAGEAGWDEYLAFVACAEIEDEARRMHPAGLAVVNQRYPGTTWPVDPASLEIRHLGIAINGAEAGVVLADFKAG